MKLKDKITVISGGASGFGEAIGHEFFRQGAKIALLDINEAAGQRVAAEICDDHEKTMYVKCDVASKKDVDEALAAVIAAWGKVDIMVNCAGISEIVPFLQHTEELWERTMAVNLKGTFLCCQAAVKSMLENGGGVIINFSSQSGKTGDSQHQAYCASKAGVIGLTQSIAAEFGKLGIRANSICPGPVFTNIWQGQLENYAHKKNMKPEDVKPYFASINPMGRVGEVEDIAKLALFLASDDSSYITGQAINISGGAVVF